jgi:hypothetical protein
VLTVLFESAYSIIFVNPASEKKQRLIFVLILKVVTVAPEPAVTDAKLLDL